jgi:hypothetical protein
MAAFVQDLEGVFNDFPFLHVPEIKGSLWKEHRRIGRGLSEGRREKSKTK